MVTLDRDCNFFCRDGYLRDLCCVLAQVCIMIGNVLLEDSAQFSLKFTSVLFINCQKKLIVVYTQNLYKDYTSLDLIIDYLKKVNDYTIFTCKKGMQFTLPKV